MNENKMIKDILSKFKDTRESYNRRSRAAYMETLKPGERTPAEGHIYGDKYLDEYRAECVKYRQQLLDIIGGAADELRKKTTEAPSPDATNAITLFAMRDRVTADEVDAMMQRYGDNVLCYHFINQVARRSKIYNYDDNPVDTQLRRIDELSASVDRMLSGQINALDPSPIGDGELWVLEAFSVNTAFPDDGSEE